MFATASSLSRARHFSNAMTRLAPRSTSSLRPFHRTAWPSSANNTQGDDGYRAPMTRQLNTKERILLLLGQEKQFQLTTSSSFSAYRNNSDTTSDIEEHLKRQSGGHVTSTIVPFVTVPKSRSQMIFEKKAGDDSYLQTPSSSTATTTNAAATATATTEAPAAAGRLHHHFRDFDVVFLVNKESRHNDALSPRITVEETVEDKDGNKTTRQRILDSDADLEHIKQLSPKSYDVMMEERVVSIMVGNSPDSTVMHIFNHTLGALPPRGVLKARVKQIRSHELAFQRLWGEYFRQHPNVKIPVGKVNMFIMTDVESAYYIDANGELSVVADSDKLLHTLTRETEADPLAPIAQKMIARLNKDQDLLHKLVSKVYNLKDVKECFVYSLHRFGIHLIGTETELDDKNPEAARSAVWQEYFLDYGFEIKTEEQLMDYLTETHKI